MNQRNGSMGLARCIPSDQQKITGYPSISKENQTLGILMRKSFLLLSLLLVSSQGQHESCPCINPWDYYNNSLSVDNCTLSNGEEGYLLQFQSQESIDCYPKEYGASCQNWDGLYRAKQCAGNGYDKEGSYCSSKWCFVDPLNCKILYQQSTLVVDVNAMDNVVYASYETCGNINAYNIDRYSTVFLNQTLTIAFPGDSSALYDLFTNSEGEKDGSSVRFFEDVQSFYNYNVDVVEISNISRQKYSSSYSACVHDVALGLVDLCVGAFYATPERQIMSSMTTSFYSSDFYLYVREKEEVKLSEMMWTPFKPFTKTAWFAIMICSLYMAIVMSLYSRCRKKNFAGENSIGSTVFDIFYTGVISFASGEPPEQDEPSKIEKVVMAGYAIFGLIVITAYTASSAAALVVDNNKATISDVNELLDLNLTACVRQTARSSAIGALRGWQTFSEEKLETNIVNCDNADIMNERLFGDNPDIRCDAAIETIDNYALYNSESNWCNLVKVGDLIVSIQNVAPVSDVFHRGISYGVSVLERDGKYASYTTSYKEQTIGNSMCEKDKGSETSFTTRKKSNSVNDGDSSNEFTQLGIENLIFAYIVTGLCTSIGFINYLWKKNREKLNLLRVNEKSSDEVLLTKVNNASPTELLRMIDRSKVINEDDFNEALNKLPDTAKLAAIAYKQWCSQDAKDRLFLESLSVSVLLELSGYKLDQNKTEDMKQSSSPVEKALNAYDTKSALIDLILRDGVVREQLSSRKSFSAVS